MNLSKLIYSWKNAAINSLALLMTGFFLLNTNLATAQLAYVANNTSGDIVVIDLSDGSIVTTIDIQGSPVKIVAAPDGSQIASLAATSVAFVDPATNTIINDVSDATASELRGIVYSDDGATLYTIDQLTTLITPYNTSTQAAGSFGFLTSGVGPLALGFDFLTGNIIAVNNGSADLATFSPALVQQGSNIAVGQAPQDIAILPGTDLAYVSNFNTDNVSVVDLSDGTTSTVPNVEDPLGIVALPDGSTVYVINNTGTVTVIETATNTVVTTITVGSTPRGVAVSPDGSQVIVANAGDNTISVIDVETNEVVNTFSTGEETGPVGVAVIDQPVSLQPPVASFTATPTSGSAPLSVAFNGNGSTDADGFITAYAFDFGDGNTAATATATNVYVTPGTYTAQLIVTDNDGLMDTTTQTITVNEPTLEELIANAVDAQTITEVLGLNFGGVSTAVSIAGDPILAQDGNASPVSPLTGTTRLGASDVTQTFLTVLALALQEEEALDLDAAISTFIDVSTLTNINGSVTIRQLLTHTSGIADFASAANYQSTILFDVTRVFTPAEITELFVGSEGTPGTFAYSNTNFLVLGLVLDAANGDETLEESLDRLISTPAGLSNVDFYQTTDPSDLAPLFDDVFGTGFPQQLTPNTSVFTGASTAGNLILTPAQMVAFIRELALGNIITPASFVQLLEFAEITGRESDDYGLGLEQFTLTIDGVELPFIGHAGDINYAGIVLYSCDADIAVSVMSNNGLVSEADVLALATQLIDIAIDGTEVTFNQAPVASAVADVNTGDAPLSVNFDGSGSTDSDGSIVSFAWDFGDGSTSADTSASNIFTVEDTTYTVTLIVTDNKGAKDTATVSITTAAPAQAPVANIVATPTSGSAPLMVAFNGNGSTDADGVITDYNWTFGDGNTAVGATASNTYADPGTYTAQLIVTDNDGLMDTTTQTITVNEPTLEEVLQNIVDASEITEISGLNFGGISAAVINSDGETFTPTSGDASPGTPMSDANTLGASDVTQTILSVLTFALMEEEALTLNTTVGELIDVSGLTNVPGTITISQLLMHTSGLADFASAADYESTILFDVTRVFTPEEITELFVGAAGTPGTFAYSNTNFLVLGLVLEAANGEETLEETLDRLIEAPASIGLEIYGETDFDGLAPLFADVFGTGFPQQLNPNTSVFTGASTAGNIFATPSDYLAFIKALVDGNIISAENFARLLDFMPITGRESTDYGKGVEQFMLDIDGVMLPFFGHVGDINYGSVLLYSCDANSGVSLVTNNAITTEAEVIELARQLLDAVIDGGSVVLNQAPTASFTADPTDGTTPLTVAVDAAASADADGTIVRYEWDFGDGNTATGVTASNTYTATGAFTITLTVRDNKGAVGTATTTITVGELTPPVADIVATPTSGSAPLTVAFNGNGSTDADGVITDYNWTFGDGNAAVGATNVNTYVEPGTYTAQLIVTDNDGLMDTTTVTITVNEPTLEEVLQNIVDASDITEELGLNFGGISAAVITSEGETFTQASGDASPGTAMTSANLLGASDVTQSILAALTFALMEEEALTLNTTVGELIDVSGLTNVSGTITIGQLLMHTSGLADFASAADYESTILFDVERIFTAAEITELFVGAAGTPGTFAYSNTNFLVLGLVLEAANGEETLEETLDRLIGTPASVSLDFYVDADPAGLAPLFADVFGTGFPQQLNPNTSVFTGASTAGNIYGTPSDYLAFIKALVDGNIISAENFARLLDFMAITGRESTDYGKGVEQFMLDIDGVMLPFFGHVGDINYGSVLLYSCDANTGVSLVTNNATATEAEVIELARQLLDAVIDGGSVVLNQAPTASFTADPTDGTSPLTVAVDAAASADADGTIVRYEWDFGDGNTATGVTASNTYTATGAFTITLTVRDNKGAVGTATTTITVGELTPPVADIVATPTAGSAPLTVAFNGNGSTDADGVITDYNWTFGDGNAAVGATNVNTYVEPGTYTAQLIVTDNDGLMDTTTVTITVNEPTLEEVLQNIVDASDITEELGLNFGGISAAVITSEGETFTQASGDASPGTAMTSANLLGASDVTQSILAALTFALMEEEALTLNTTVGELIDVSGLTNVSGTITIGQLLMHTSGLADFASAADYESTILFDVERIFTAAEITELFVGAAGTPGTFAYSNTNFLVLGLVLEAANGEETLEETLDRLIGTPASVSLDFYVDADPAGLAPLFADVFGTGFPQQLNPNTSVFTGASTAGNIYGTPSDYLAFIKALVDGNIISAENFARLLDFMAITGRESTDYGKGVEQFMLDIDGVMLPFFGHVGDINYGSVLLYSCDANTGVSLVTNNATATEAEVIELARQLLDAVIDGGSVVLNQAPTASFTADPTEGEAPLTVNVDAAASSDADGSIVRYEWDFGDGNTATGVTASNEYMSSGSFTITLTVRDNKGAVGTATETITVGEAPEAFSLQILHASDLEGGLDALSNAPNFAAIIDALEEENENTLILSAGDNYIPGPFFNAAGNSDIRPTIQSVYQDLFNEPGLTNYREGSGRVDISIMNIIGFDASAIGNHEFDAGPNAFAGLIETDIRGPELSDVRWLGAQFPYLSANLDFSSDDDLNGLFTSDILDNNAFQSLPDDLTAAAAAPKLAQATTIQRGGETIGVIGATTQILEQITSTGEVMVVGPTEDDMPALAEIIQPLIDGFEEDGVNKIILVTHLQQIALEKALAQLLSGVDVIIAGGSDVLQAQPDDVLRPGDTADEGYPFVTTNLDNDPALVVGTDGEYSYVGRLIIEFDENGVIVPGSFDNELNGAYPSIASVVDDVAGPGAFDPNTKGELVERLIGALQDVINETDGVILGQTSVFIEGRREAVRTEETNLGNLTADANLVTS